MKVKVAAIQMSADIGGREANVERAERLLIQAARQGADLCVLPELALDEFFPLYKDTRYFAYAEELDGPTVRRFRSLAGELGIYLALPLFEKSLIGTYYNSLVLLTPEGRYTYPVRAAMSATISHPDRSLWWRIPGTGRWDWPSATTGATRRPAVS